MQDREKRIRELEEMVSRLTVENRILTERSHGDAEAKFRILSEGAQVGIYIVQDGFFVYANPAAAKSLGYTTGELIGMTPYQTVHPDDHRILTEQIRRRMDNETDTVHYEVRCVRKDGSVGYFEVLGSRINHRGRPALMGNLLDVTEQKTGEEKIKKALAEKEALLRELYHRTKNNMQLISSLLDLHAGAYDDPRISEVFTETQNRIRTMALVHEKLYESGDLSRVNMKEYISELAWLIIESYHIAPGRITLVPEMDDVFVLIDIAIPCGLIINELVTNIVKYAFPDQGRGEIRLGLSRSGNGEITMTVSDNGVGVPPGFDIRKDGRVGTQTVLIIGEIQLKGRVDFKSNGGVSFCIRFMDRMYTPRI